MNITDELRAYAGNFYLFRYKDVREKLDAIADRIDAEHEQLMGEQYKSLTIGMEPMTDESMAELGWVRLPVDADGVPIRVGDVVDVTPTDKFTGHMNVVVTSVIFKRSAALVTVDTADRPFTFWPNRIRHHHAPTVEDVLREMVAAYMDTPLDDSNDGEFFAQYAAKLQLVESDAE